MPEAGRHAELIAQILNAVIDGYDENAVREEVLSPLLHALGYARGDGTARIAAPRDLKRIMVGSKPRTITRPDYIAEVDRLPAFVVEAKAPDEPVGDAECEQACWYALHNDVNAPYVLVSNGNEFCLRRAGPSPNQQAELLRFRREELRAVWPQLAGVLAPGPLRMARIKDAGLRAAKSLPGGGAFEASVRISSGEAITIDMHPASGSALEAQVIARGSAAAQKLRAVADGASPDGAVFDQGELDVKIGEVSLDEHFGVAHAVEIKKIPPKQVTVALLTGKSLVTLRVTAVPTFDPVTKTVEVGSAEAGVRLKFADGAATCTLEPTGRHVLDALRIIEFGAALSREKEVLVLDPSSPGSALAGQLDLPPYEAEVLLPLLRIAAYVAVRLGCDLRFTGDVAPEDATNAAMLAMLLRGEPVPMTVSFVTSADAAAQLTDKFWPQGWAPPVFGTSINPGPVAFHIGARRSADPVGENVRVTLDGHLQLEAPPAARTERST